MIRLHGKRSADAESQSCKLVQVYRADLAVYPDNGWSLHGLSEALHRQKKFAEVEFFKPKHEAVWKYADAQIDSSCPQFSSPWVSAGL